MENFKVITHVRFGKVRRVELETKFWFVGKDIASILGYARPDSFVSKHIQKEDKQYLMVPAFDFLSKRRSVVINERGVDCLLNAASSPSAPAIRQWLLGDKETPQKVDELLIRTVKGIRCYVDGDMTAHINAEDVARGLGFVEVMKDRAATSGGNFPTAIRWARINEYLASFGYPHKVGKDDFIPENMFYRLAMKANSETANKFQAKIADEIMPSIRKYGYYAAPDSSLETKQIAFDLHCAGQKLVESSDKMIPADVELAHELIAIADRIHDDTARDKILIYAANLLLGQRFF